MGDKKQQIEELASEIEKRLECVKSVVGSMNKGIGYWIAEDLVEKGYTKEYISEERAREIGKEMFNKVRKETAKEIFKKIALLIPAFGYEKLSEVEKRLVDGSDFYYKERIEEIFEEYGVEVEE